VIIKLLSDDLYAMLSHMLRVHQIMADGG